MNSSTAFVILAVIIAVLVVNQLYYWKQKRSGKTIHFLWPLGRIAACLVGGLVGGIILALLGLVVGAYYGGNYATDFEFNGVRGYEATGQIGAILGFAAGAPLCAALLFYRTKGRR